MLLEHVREMGGIAETERMGDLRDRTSCVKQLVAGMLDTPPLVVRHGTPPGGFAKDGAEVVGTKPQHMGQCTYAEGLALGNDLLDVLQCRHNFLAKPKFDVKGTLPCTGTAQKNKCLEETGAQKGKGWVARNGLLADVGQLVIERGQFVRGKRETYRAGVLGLSEEGGGEEQGHQAVFTPMGHKVIGEPLRKIVQVRLVESGNTVDGVGHPRCENDNGTRRKFIFTEGSTVQCLAAANDRNLEMIVGVRAMVLRFRNIDRTTIVPSRMFGMTREQAAKRSRSRYPGAYPYRPARRNAHHIQSAGVAGSKKGFRTLLQCYHVWNLLPGGHIASEADAAGAAALQWIASNRFGTNKAWRASKGANSETL